MSHREFDLTRYVAENYTPPPYIHKQVLPKVSPMYREFSFDVREFAINFVSHNETRIEALNRHRDYLAIKFAYGKQVRTETVEEPPVEVSKHAVEPYKVYGFGGYASVKDALIGFLNSEGLESVLQYWGIVPTRVRLEMTVPTAIVHTYRKHVYNNAYVNVIPLPKEFKQHQIRYAMLMKLKGEARYKFEDAVDNFDEVSWLTSTPPTSKEIKEAVTLPYEDVNFAPLMQRWG